MQLDNVSKAFFYRPVSLFFYVDPPRLDCGAHLFRVNYVVRNYHIYMPYKKRYERRIFS